MYNIITEYKLYAPVQSSFFKDQRARNTKIIKITELSSETH